MEEGELGTELLFDKVHYLQTVFWNLSKNLYSFVSNRLQGQANN
jgi:hypothetical protein